MFSFLKNHPFPVEAYFTQSLVVTYAVPAAEIKGMLPECLEPDTFLDKWAFVAVALVQTKNLRPKGLPAFFGQDFFLTGYRVFVRYRNAAGRSLRGLYILRSETDKRSMQFFGNLFTHYQYRTVDIRHTQENNVSTIASVKSGFTLSFKREEADAVPLPAGSPFPDWKLARRYAGPLPFTFTWNTKTRRMLIIEGVRENWKPAPVQVMHHHFPFIDQLGFSSVILANAFIIENIPYYWKKGKTELWQEEENFRVS